MPVRFGISPIGWSNDDLPELGGDTPLATCLAEARLAGFAGIELGHKFPRDPAVLRLQTARVRISWRDLMRRRLEIEQLEVEHDAVRMRATNAGDRVAGGFRLADDADAVEISQQLDQPLADGGRIFNDEYCGHSGCDRCFHGFHY